MVAVEVKVIQLHHTRAVGLGLALIALFALEIVPLLVAGADLYPVTLRAFDANDNPLIAYTLFFSVASTNPAVVYNNTLNTIPGDNKITLMLLPSTYTVTVSAFNIKIGSTTLQVSDAKDVSIMCNVYTLTVRFMKEEPAIQTWTAVAYVGTVTFTSNFTQGRAVFDQVPGGPGVPVTVTVYDPQGKKIAVEGTELLSNDELTLEASEFYSVLVIVRDQNAMAVKGAIVSIGVFSNVTRDDGRTTITTQPGFKPVRVYFLGTNVYSGQVDSSQTPNLLVNSTIATLNILLLDESSQPIKQTPIMIQFGNYTQTITTDNNGRLKIQQCPYGDITLHIPSTKVPPTLLKFPLAPTLNNTLSLFIHPIDVSVETLSAYMLGSMTIRVMVKAGSYMIKNATIYVNGKWAATTALGYAIVQVPIGLDPNPVVDITVKAYGTETKREVTMTASPLVVITVPFGILPVIVWRMMVNRYKRKRVPLAV